MDLYLIGKAVRPLSMCRELSLGEQLQSDPIAASAASARRVQVLHPTTVFAHLSVGVLHAATRRLKLRLRAVNSSPMLLSFVAIVSLDQSD
eukprot:2395773-Amphidinium_carterae.1